MQDFQEELMAAEQRYWDAMQRRDVADAIALTDEPAIIVGAQGLVSVDRAKLAELMANAAFELEHYVLDDRVLHIRKLTDDVVVLAYPVTADLVVDGELRTLFAFDASVWVRRGTEWRCALHTESPQAEPFALRR